LPASSFPALGTLLPARLRSLVAHALVLPFVLTTLTLPVQWGRWQAGVAWAEAADDKPVLGIVPFARRGDARTASVASIQDYLRDMLDAGGAVRLLAPKVVDTGKASAPLAKEVDAKAVKDLTPAGKALEKADKLSLTARTMLDEGEEAADVMKLLVAAAQRYEDNFQELVDYTKLVDVYAQAATASLALSNPKDARDWVTKALVLQPSFVVDARKANKELAKITNEVRTDLESKPKTTVTVDCSQKDAEVFVDGVKLGAPPATAPNLVLGTHYVQVRKAGALPWGQKLATKGKALTVKATLQMEPTTEGQIVLEIAPEDIKAYAASGAFHEKLFKNQAAAFAKQIRATHLLYGVVTSTSRALELHLFLYSAKLKKTCALERIDYQSSLTDLQMKTLDGEGRVRAALGNCAKEVLALPSVYGSGPAPAGRPSSDDDEPELVRKPEVVKAPEVVRGPEVGRGGEASRSDDDSADATEAPKPEPRVVVTPPKKETKPAPQVTGDASGSDPYAGLVGKDEPSSSPAWYKTWWFWTGTAVVVGAAVAVPILLTQGSAASGSGFTASVTLP
jgi:hypothetical protein